jgi:hypothetical protein
VFRFQVLNGPVPAALFGALDPKFAWYVARASGIVAWAVVTASILWGLAVSTKLVRRKGVPAWLLDLHRFLGALSVVFVAIHVVALWADNYVYFGPRELFLPMASPWKPGAIAWGIVATYLLVAIQVTSWAKRSLPRSLWHAVHMSSFPLFVAATIHGLASGTDRSNVVLQWLALTGVLLVIFLVLFQLLAPKRGAVRSERNERAAPAPVS